MTKLFFELIQVALGARPCLSRTPSLKEWQMLYDMAKKQSLVGVCFAGVQRLCDSASENYCGMSEIQYLTWMGMAAKIQQRNQVVDEQCTQLQAKFSVDGVPSRILKGQGVAKPIWGATSRTSPIGRHRSLAGYTQGKGCGLGEGSW